MIFRLKELREAKHLSQLKLAMDLHLSQNSISRYENLEREAGYETLILIADYFHVSNAAAGNRGKFLGYLI